MAMEHTTGQMDASMLGSGRMENSTEKAYLLQHQAWREKGIGRMELGLVGRILNDLCNN